MPFAGAISVRLLWALANYLHFWRWCFCFSFGFLLKTVLAWVVRSGMILSPFPGCHQNSLKFQTTWILVCPPQGPQMLHPLNFAIRACFKLDRRTLFFRLVFSVAAPETQWESVTVEPSHPVSTPKLGCCLQWQGQFCRVHVIVPLPIWAIL